MRRPRVRQEINEKSASGNPKEALPAVERACQWTKSKRDLEKYEALRKQIKAEMEKIKK